jgi:hypothetical protein
MNRNRCTIVCTGKRRGDGVSVAPFQPEADIVRSLFPDCGGARHDGGIARYDVRSGFILDRHEFARISRLVTRLRYDECDAIADMPDTVAGENRLGRTIYAGIGVLPAKKHALDIGDSVANRVVAG